MPSFFADFRKPFTFKSPSCDIASTSEADGRSSYPPSVLERTSTTDSVDEQSLYTEKPSADGRGSSSRPPTAPCAEKPPKNPTSSSQSRPSQQRRHRRGLGSPRERLSQPVVSFSTPSIPRPPKYRKHSAFARRNEPENAATVHGGPCAQALKAIVHVLNTILVRPISVATQQVSKSCFGGRVTTRRKPAWVVRR